MTSITSQAAAALIAAGKTAVEAELTRIEGDISTAIASGKAEAATLATALAFKLDAHTAEAAATQQLLTRATATVNPSAAAAIGGAPVITLTTPTGVSAVIAKIKTWLAANGWKGYALLGVGLLVLKYMFDHKIII